mgnify:CR=1 FL=1
MKKIVFILALILILQNCAFAEKPFYNDKNLWGIKGDDETVLVEPEYKKLIILGENTYIVQKRGKFGVIDSSNNILVPIKYTHAERVLGKFVKLGNGSKYGIYNAEGKELLPVEYSSINLLFGGMFLTCKGYKYGITDFEGNVILENKFDEIYMPEKSVMRIKYEGKWYELEQVKGETLTLPKDVKTIKTNKNIAIFEILEHPATATGYSVVTCTDYFIKLFSSISPAHEQTIDTLMLSQGADAVTIYFKFGWIPKYPVIFAKNYFNTLKNPNSGPLSEVRFDLKQKMQ